MIKNDFFTVADVLEKLFSVKCHNSYWIFRPKYQIFSQILLKCSDFLEFFQSIPSHNVFFFLFFENVLFFTGFLDTAQTIHWFTMKIGYLPMERPNFTSSCLSRR